MGKTSKWLRMLLGGKRDHNNKHSPPSEKKQEPVVVDAQAKEKRRWSFSRHSMKERHRNEEVEEEGGWVGKYERHALAVAAADAAIAAAQAAAAAVHWAASPRPSVYENMAAITIQTTFRGYLARRALKALKGVVKLQALVRGYLVRKRADATLSCMQSLIRVQTRARANRLFTTDAGRFILHHHHFLKSKAVNHDHATRKSMDGWNLGNESGAYTQSSRRGSLYLSQQEHERSLEENAKVVEVDTYSSSRAKRNNNNWKRRYINNTASDSGSAETSSLPNAFSTSTLHSHSPASVSDEVAVPQDYSPLTVSSSDCWAFGNFRKEYLLHPEDCRPSTTNNSPRLLSRLGLGLGFNTGGGGLTPPNVGGFPSYMSYTQSSKAKVRSQSAPRQRGEKNATPCRKKTPSPSHAHTPPPLLDSRASFSGFNVPRSPFVQLQPENKGAAPPALYNGKVEGPTMSFRDTTSGRFNHNW